MIRILIQICWFRTLWVWDWVGHHFHWTLNALFLQTVEVYESLCHICISQITQNEYLLNEMKEVLFQETIFVVSDQLHTNVKFCCFILKLWIILLLWFTVAQHTVHALQWRDLVTSIYSISICVSESGGLLLFIRSRNQGQTLFNIQCSLDISLSMSMDPLHSCKYLTWPPVASFIIVYISIVLHAVKN